MSTKRIIVPGGVDEYIKNQPVEVQDKLKDIRAAIRDVVPDAIETLSYFQFPGYHYDGDYYYNGMFAWFSYKKPYIRLHIYPEVIINNKSKLSEYKLGAGDISCLEDKQFPENLIKKLVKESFQAMKDRPKAGK
jgi:uncharacterized protein YdhG (YjbR/CyaY superfamily)